VLWTITPKWVASQKFSYVKNVYFSNIDSNYRIHSSGSCRTINVKVFCVFTKTYYSSYTCYLIASKRGKVHKKTAADVKIF